MLARLLVRVMDAQAVWTRPLGDLTHRFVHWMFGLMPALRDLLNGRWLGHPLHALLTDAPIGILFLVIVFDVLGDVGAATGRSPSASSRCSGRRWPGTRTMRIPTARRASGQPSTPRSCSPPSSCTWSPCGSGSGAARSGRRRNRMVSILAFLVLSAGAYVGGDVVYVLGNMVSRHAFRGAGTKWIALEPAELDGGAIPEGRPIKAKLGINQLVLVRQGEQDPRAARHLLPRRRAAVGGQARRRNGRVPVARVALPARERPRRPGPVDLRPARVRGAGARRRRLGGAPPAGVSRRADDRAGAGLRLPDPCLVVLVGALARGSRRWRHGSSTPGPSSRPTPTAPSSRATPPTRRRRERRSRSSTASSIGGWPIVDRPSSMPPT